MTTKNVADLEVSMMLTNNAIHTHMMPTAAADLENVCDYAPKNASHFWCPTLLFFMPKTAADMEHVHDESQNRCLLETA